MAVVFHNGKVAFQNGKVVMGCECCIVACNSCSPSLKFRYDITLSGGITVNGCNSHNYTWASGTYTLTWAFGCTWQLGSGAGNPRIWMDWIGSAGVGWRYGFEPYGGEDCHSDWINRSKNESCDPTDTGVPWDNFGTTCGCSGPTAGSKSVTLTIVET